MPIRKLWQQIISNNSIPVLAAALLARIPNFILPIFAFRIFHFSDYIVFAAAIATASAMAAFLGEAISVTISRETDHVMTKRPEGGIAAFFCASTLVSYLFIIVALILYRLFFAGVDTTTLGASSPWLFVVYTVLLVPAFLLPAGTVALAHAKAKAAVSGLATLFGVPLALVISLTLGMYFGLFYFFAAYFVCVLLTNAYVFIKVVPDKFSFNFGLIIKTLRSYGPAFLLVLGPSMLGGPIHGHNLSLLNREQNGATDMAIFVAYYPWSIIVSFFPAISTNFVIQKIVEIRQKLDTVHLIKFLQKVFILNLTLAVLISLFIFSFRSYLFAFYKSTIAQNEMLLSWILLCGIAAACVMTSTQIIIAMKRAKGLLICAISHATIYTGLTLYFVASLHEGAIGLARALSMSLFFLAFMHLVLILFYVRTKKILK